MQRFALVAAVAVALSGLLAGAASAQVVAPAKQAVATGKGGAASSVDPLGTQAAIDVLKSGGNAVDAAVAAAAVLGVTEPYSCGVGGGGFMVIYRAADRKTFTIDGREMAPAAFRPDIFIDPATGTPLPFAEAVESGLSVGVPGTPDLPCSRLKYASGWLTREPQRATAAKNQSVSCLIGPPSCAPIR